MDGAFTSAGMDGSSDWRFKTHLANLPIYYEYKGGRHRLHRCHQGHLSGQLQADLGSVHHRFHLRPKLLASKTGNDAVAEFVGEKAVFYQNGTWA